MFIYHFTGAVATDMAVIFALSMLIAAIIVPVRNYKEKKRKEREAFEKKLKEERLKAELPRREEAFKRYMQSIQDFADQVGMEPSVATPEDADRLIKITDDYLVYVPAVRREKQIELSVITFRCDTMNKPFAFSLEYAVKARLRESSADDRQSKAV